MFRTSENNVSVFIDASNLWQAQKIKGQFLDLSKLKDYLKFEYKAKVIEVFYYDAYPAGGTRDYDLDAKHKFYTFLKKRLKFNVRKKPLKRISIPTTNGYIIQEKGNMDVEMAIDVVHNHKKYDIAILFSGDSDFLALVNYLKSRDKKVYIYSSKKNISMELRTSGTGYIDVLKIDADIWGRPLTYRK